MAEQLVLPEAGPPITRATFRDVIGDAFAVGAHVVIVPVGRLDPAFFDLRSGVAGDIVQAFVNYQLRLVVLGPLPPVATTSRSFVAFALEANRGTQTWFVDTAAELERRLAGEG